MLSLLDRLAAVFPQVIRDRGRFYQQGGQVKITSANASRIDARVRGGESYDVTVSRDDRGDIQYRCTCPFFGDVGLCKHIWATLLEADRRGVLAPLGIWRPSGSEVTEPHAGSLEGHDDEDLGHDLAAPPTPPPSRSRFTPFASPAPSGSASSSGTDWKRKLREAAQLAAAQLPPPAQASPVAAQRLVYVLDPYAGGSYDRTGLSVEVALESRRRNGDWTVPRQLGVGSVRWTELADQADQEIGQMLVGATSNAYFYPGQHSRFTLAASSCATVVSRMCATGRCRIKLDAESKSGIPVTLDERDPWELRLIIRKEDPGTRFRVDAVLERGDQTMSLAEPQLILDGGLLVVGNTVARYDDHGAFPLIATLRASGPLMVPARDASALVAELYAIPSLPPVEWPPELGVEELRPKPRPRLQLEAPEPSPLMPARVTGELSFDYGGSLVHPETPSSAVVTPDGRRVVHRDPTAEQAAVTRLHVAGFRLEFDVAGGRQTLVLPASKLGRVLHELIAEGWRVDLSGHRYRAAGARSASIRSGIDWFDLDGHVKFGNQQAPLPRLLAALRRGEETIELEDGSLGILPVDWLTRLAKLADLGIAADGSLRFARTQVALLDALLATTSDVTADQRFERARDELRSFERVGPIDAPPGFHGELRPYQRDGLGWLDFLRRFGFGGCLANEMGLGKTIQLLALLEMRRAENAGPSLVVIPRSLVFNWQREAARFTPSVRVLDHSGATRGRTVEQFNDYDLILTTYGTLRRDALLFRDVTFDYVVLDEAQAIKNARTASAKAALALNARHRLALTGTPVENHLGELWSLFEFLNPGMLGTASVFRRLHATTNGAPVTVAPDTGVALARALAPFILRRKKEQVAPELPEKVEQTIYVDLEGEERALYDELRDHYRTTLATRINRLGIARSQIQILEALLRLRQAACHPGLLDKKRVGDSSSKMDALIPQIAEVVESGHKVLVFSQFTSLLAILRPKLDAEGIVYEYLDGQTRDREERVVRFQTDASCPVFLISLRAGGFGLNLTAADYVFLLDPWWNPAVEAQAIDRTHRIGQTRKVVASRLIARDTVEERVLELQESKRALANAIIGEDSGVIGRIGRDELEALLA